MTALPTRSRAVSITLFILVSWAGFLVHTAPRFPGSPLGLACGIAAALLLATPLVYSRVKRSASERPRGDPAKWFAWHLWTGWLAGGLAVIHSGHKLESAIGIALITALLLTLLTGYIGQYYHAFQVTAQREKESQLQALHSKLLALKHAVSTRSAELDEARGRAHEAERLVAAIADLEHGIFFDDRLHGQYRTWWGLHVIAAVALYGLLALHVGMGLVFGIDWLD